MAVGAIAGVGERLHVGPGRRRHLLACHVGLDQRLAEDAGVDHQHFDALLASAIGEEPVLAPFVSSVPTKTTVGDRRGSVSVTRPSG